MAAQRRGSEGKLLSYRQELCAAMGMLASRGAIFVGQAVEYKGTAMHDTLDAVPMAQRKEFPVAEDAQLGYCIGRSLAGDLTVCMYPRFSFLLLATSQLVLGLDKLPLYSGFRPRVIIRTAVPTATPLNPGPQHLGDFTEAFRSMLDTVRVVHLRSEDQIAPEYDAAAERDGSTLLVERTELYA